MNLPAVGIAAMKLKRPTSDILVDHDGFVKSFALWSREQAQQIANQSGYDELTEDQWKVIFALRGEYQLHRTIPNLHNVCKKAGLEHFCLEKLFHNHGLDAWKIAGLPNPGEEIKAYL
jgi:TusE/DsrC/DsvC family sulfur relay protein